MVSLIGYTKLTTVFLVLALLFYLFMRLRLYKFILYNLSFIIISVIGVVFVVFSLFIVANRVAGFEAQSVSIFHPFHFLRTWIKPSLWLFSYFFVVFGQ
jgi:hypothetical protein